MIIDYDPENDTLFIHQEYRKGETFKFNIDLDDVVLDVGTSGKIRGIEFLNASKLLSPLGLTSEDLKAIDGASIVSQRRANTILLKFKLIVSSRSKEVEAPLYVPLRSAPLST